MGKRKLDLINDENRPVQLSLLSAPGTEDRGLEERAFPTIVRDAAGFKEVLRRCEKTGLCAIDYEFRSYSNPSIFAIAVRDLTCGLRFDRTLHRYLADAVRSGIKLVAHSGFGADKPVFDAVEGYESAWESWEDSMLLGWFENSHLTKAPTKDESDDSGALGFMDLWTQTSLVARVPNWKEHRGSACHGPCPNCDPTGYCAIDAWAGLEVFTVNRERLLRRGFPWKTFENRSELANYLFKMEQRGINVNREFISKFDELMDKAKSKLYPLDDKGNMTPYNPRSSQQVIEYFKTKRITLKSNNKEDIEKALMARCKPMGYMDLKQALSAEDLPSEIEELRTLYRYKDSGKGSDPWFEDKYFHKDGLVHPRYIYVGTSTGRLSCAKPNFTNVPSRGWGSLIKAGIIPHDPENMDVLDADIGQLEFRAVLHQAGFPLETIKGDALAYILASGGERFDRAAQIGGKKARDVVKTVVYAAQYGEGIQIYSGSDLMRPSVQNEISKGAIRLYTPQYVPWLLTPWEYAGGIVGFTGANLSETLFGDKTHESRRKALEIQDDIVFGGDLKIIRQWQIKVCQHIELNGSVTLPNGQFLRLNGSARDNAKVGFAFLGQGFGSIYAQSGMLACIRENKHLPLLQVHDSLVYAVNRSWSDRKVREFMSPMFGPVDVLGGFQAPGGVKRGRNYGGFDKELNPGGLRLMWNSAKENVDGSAV